MNAINPETPTIDIASARRSLRNPLRKETETATDATPKLKTTKSKLKKVAVVAGSVVLVGVVAGALAKKKSPVEAAEVPADTEPTVA